MQPPTPQEEYLDILDELGNVVGQERRSRCHSNKALRHRAVHVFVRNRRSEIFLQRRARTKTVQPGKWDTSVGGHLKVGESFEDAAARELEEELGVSIEDLGGPATLQKRHDYVWHSPIETEHVRTFETLWEGPFRLQSDEIEEGRFWSETELCQSVGTGVLTPNLEEELRLLEICDQADQKERERWDTGKQL